MSKIDQIIREEFERQIVLKELFEKTYNFWIEEGSYPNKVPANGKIVYRFNTKNHNYEVPVKYRVRKEREKSEVEIEFGTEEEGLRDLTNEGVPSQVLATVVKIMKEVLKNLPPLEKIETAATKKGDEESRFSFYKKAIKRLLPGAKIKVRDEVWEALMFDVILPKNYKEKWLNKK